MFYVLYLVLYLGDHGYVRAKEDAHRDGRLDYPGSLSFVSGHCCGT